MANEEIIIDITCHLIDELTRASQNPQTMSTGDGGAPNVRELSKTLSIGKKDKKNLQFQAYAGMASKLLNATGDEALQNIGSGISQATSWAGKIARSFTSPLAAASFATDVAAIVIDKVMTSLRQGAKEANEVDDARFAYGVMDLSGYSVNKNWVGRYTYEKLN